ncbi:DUF1876 domain-containing protein [Streptosporangium sp. CA-135522]|uniref:DUF1876 domain-containing protein n=1 Tax=Streptosporangium sp. CA-135522 TaxID=3240072 RepID=UPI003D8C8760
MESKQWDVQIFISEDDDDAVTTAKVVLMTPDGRRRESVAYARRNPEDRPVPTIGDELAAGRALSDLAGKLMREGAEDVAQLAGHAPRAW